MAEYDGDIKLRVSLDPTDVKSSAKNLKRDIDGILSSTNTSGADQIDAKLQKILGSMAKAADESDKLVASMQNMESAQIPTEEFTLLSQKLLDLDTQIHKVVEDSRGIESAMAQLQNTRIPTEEYKEVSAFVDKTQASLTKLQEKMEKFVELGGSVNSKAFKSMQYDAAQLENTLEYAKGELQDLVDTGKAFTLGSDTEQYKQLEAQSRSMTDNIRQLTQEYANAKNELDQMVNTGQDFRLGSDSEEYEQTASRVEHLNNRMRELLAGYNRYSEQSGRVVSNTERLRVVFTGLYNVLSRINQTATGIFRRMRESLRNVRNEANHTDINFKKMLRTFLKYALGIRSFYFLFRRIRSAILDGLKSMAQWNAGNNYVNRSISALSSSLQYLKNSWSAAFAPIVEFVTPVLVQLMDLLSRVAFMISQFFGALTGKSTIIKATKVNKDYAASLKEAGGSAKEANKQLSKLDKLNVLSSPSSGGGGGGVGELFEEVPIDSKFKDLAEKFKKFLDDLLRPIKKAWDKMGKLFINSWKNAFKKIISLAKTVGKDFMKVWNEYATQKIIEDIIFIGAKIGDIFGYLAENIEKAWKKNDTGLKILRSIRDIIGIIVSWIKRAAIATAAWAKGLDFSPILEAFQRFLEAMKPVIDGISQIFYTFYTDVILKFGKYLIESGLPDFLDALSRIANRIDFDKLNKTLSDFWSHLEPFLERVWKGFVIFFEQLGNAIADFINSDFVQGFLGWLGGVLDSLSEEDIAHIIWGIVNALIAMRIATTGWHIATSVLNFLSTVGTLFGGSAGVAAGNGFAAAGSGLAILASALGEFLALVAEIGAGAHLGKSLRELFGFDATQYYDNPEGWWWSEELNKIWKDTVYLFTEAIPNDIRKGDWIGLGNDIMAGIWGGLMSALYLIAEPFVAIFDWILSFFGIASPAKKMYPVGFNIMDGIVQGMSQFINGAVKIFQDIFSWIWNGLCSIFGIASPAKTMEPIGQNIMGGIQSGLEQGEPGILAVFNGLLDLIKTPINALLGLVESMCNGIISAINGMIGALNSVKFDIPSWIPGIGGNKFGLSIPRIGGVKIPRLAQGSVIPPNKEFLAVLGDQKNETNVEAPLSTIKQAVAEVFGEMGFEVPVVIDGREVARAVVNWNNQYKKQHGGRTALG